MDTVDDPPGQKRPYEAPPLEIPLSRPRLASPDSFDSFDCSDSEPMQPEKLPEKSLLTCLREDVTTMKDSVLPYLQRIDQLQREVELLKELLLQVQPSLVQFLDSANRPVPSVQPARAKGTVPQKTIPPKTAEQPRTVQQPAPATATTTKTLDVSTEALPPSQLAPPPRPKSYAAAAASSAQRLALGVNSCATAEEQLKFLCRRELPEDQRTSAVSSVIFTGRLSAKALAAPLTAWKLSVKAWSGHEPLHVSLLSPTKAEIFYDTR